MNLSLHIFVFFYLQYFVLPSESFIEEHHLDFFDGVTKYDITSTKYPLETTDDPIDIIWHCHRSIKLEIKDFALDGQNGDFLMVSDVPLDSEDLDLGDLDPMDPEFRNAILVSNGLLLSWAVNQSIQVHSDHGSFIYFHAQPPLINEDRKELFKGFNITIFDFDHLRATTPVTTEEPEVTSPSSGKEIYLNVFLSCSNPQEFVDQKEKFKEHLAVMATNYCIVKGDCNDVPICNEDQNCVESGFENFTIAEVSIPDRGMFYCDPKWPVSPNCVEVRFAIVRSINGTYIMTKRRLEEMWMMNIDYLKENGYCPYSPPSDEGFQVWVWVAFILGIILVLSALFCVVWIKKSSEDYNKRISSKPVKTSDDDKTEGITGLSDRTNPLAKFIKRLGRGGDDAQYSEMVNELGNMVESDRPTVRQNQLYHSMHGDHDNHGYIEEMDVEFERPNTPSSTNNGFSRVDFMNITELQAISDTEI